MTAVLPVPPHEQAGERVDQRTGERTGGPLRAGAVLALAGVVLLAVGTVLHPTHEDPNDAVAAFTEYAATGRGAWLVAHLLQLAGVTGTVLAVVVLSAAVARPSSVVAQVTRALGVAALAVTAALQAVDGVAVKAVVDRWADAPAPGRPAAFAAAFAVRQVEVGLAALSALVLAAAFVAFGVLLVAARGGWRPWGALTVAAGAVSGTGGVLMGLGGFSGAAMDASLTGSGLGVVALVAVAVRSWRAESR
jgi:hypothetical protein